MQPLLLLHGAIGASDQLQPLSAALQPEFSTRLLNFNGHGGKSFSSGFSIPDFAAEVLEYLDSEELETIDIFGYSMGGYVGLYLSLVAPHRIRSVVTLATKFHWEIPTAEKESRMLEPDTILEKLPAFARQLEQRHQPNDWKKVLEETRRLLFSLGENNLLNEENCRNMKTPALLLLGEKDRMVSQEETVAISQWHPFAQFRLLPGTPHPLEQVDTEMLAGVMKSYLLREKSLLPHS